MERRVPCPNCDHQMTVKIWSETLTQVLKCSSCSKKFTYDPSKAPPKEPEQPPAPLTPPAPTGPPTTAPSPGPPQVPAGPPQPKTPSGPLAQPPGPPWGAQQAQGQPQGTAPQPRPSPTPPQASTPQQRPSGPPSQPQQQRPSGAGRPGGPRRRGQKKGPMSRMLGKGLRGGLSIAAKPVKSARNEMNKFSDSVNKAAHPTAPESLVRAANGQSPVEPRPTSKMIQCPGCTTVFEAGLPDNEKQLLTTRCPECSNIFTFNRLAPPAVISEQVGTQAHTQKIRPQPSPQMPVPPTTLPTPIPAPPPSEPPEPEIPDDEDFAMPIGLKEKLERERLEAAEQDSESPDSEGDGSDEQWDDDDAELAPPPGRTKGPRGRLLSVTCPYCNEAFGTPAPKTRSKVFCPICENDFMINSHGELMAKKALGGFSGGLAKIVGVEAIQGYKETFQDSLEGFELIRNSDNLHHHMRSHSGKAGFILMVVAVLGILFAGSLLVSIPGSSEDDASGNVRLTGVVMNGMDLVEDADVTIMDLGLSDRTNSEGGFTIEGVEPGDHTIEISADGMGTLTVRFTVGSRDTKDGSKDLSGLVIPDSGTEVKDMRVERADRAGLVLCIQAAFVFVISLLALMAGFLAIQGKRFHATLFLAGISIVSIGFFIGMVLAIVSVILIILGRREFIS